MGEALTIRATGAATQTYEEYYRLSQSPFSLAPDPHFLYLSESHDDAIRQLLEAARRNEGVIVLTGDVGTGKTTIARALLTRLDRTSFASLVLNPFVSVDELLREILLDFGVISRDDIRSGRAGSASRHDLTSTLHDFLLSLHPIGAHGVLIIDEAQHLPADVLEQIRVISTVETTTTNLLQVILIGQPSLLDALAQDHLRQLDSRVSVRAMLKPLGRDDVEAYVSHRLSVAGNSGGVRFDRDAIDAVASLSGGLPRLINLLCDRALMAGVQTEAQTIDAATVHEAGAVLGMTAPEAPARVRRRPWHRSLWIVAALLVLVLGGLRVAATQRIDPPSPPTAPPPAPRAAAIQPRPLPDPSDYPPDPPVQRPVALPTFGPQ
ncbi:MAG TPA: AAA family ATPase [Vicinamibacterales bacterium]|nr:AAA family ATPase [Vicinamibacterales bacterium]